MRYINLIIAALALGCSSTPDYTADCYVAKWNVRDEVKKHLKAPTTATFTDEESNTLDGILFAVTGTVHSQNSFGAMLAAPYKAMIVKENDVWKLVGIECEGYTWTDKDLHKYTEAAIATAKARRGEK